MRGVVLGMCLIATSGLSVVSFWTSRRVSGCNQGFLGCRDDLLHNVVCDYIGGKICFSM